MTAEEREELATTIAVAIAKTHPCRFPISSEVHERDHQMMKDASEVLARLKNVRWGVFQMLIYAGTIILIGWMAAGALADLKVKIMGG